MNVREVRLWHYAIPFVAPTFGKAAREGFFLELRFKDGARSFGECAPWPGVHRESLADAETQLQAIASAPESVAEALESPNLHPTVQWCLHQAVWNATRPPLAWNLESASLYNLRHQASRAKQIGLFDESYRVAKIKVGALEFDQQWQDFTTFVESLAEGCQLRLDPNGMLSQRGFLRLRESPWRERLQFLEDPFEKTSWPLANVKLARDGSFPEMADMADVWILKPTRFGSPQATMNWIQRASAAKIPVILSSCFESGLTLQTFCEMATDGNLTEAMGFGSYRYLAEDVLPWRLTQSQRYEPELQKCRRLF